MNRILYDGEYIVATAQTANGTDENADTVEDMLCHQPSAPDDYTYRLKTDLTWELCELPAEEETEDDEATSEDLENAFRELGVM